MLQLPSDLARSTAAMPAGATRPVRSIHWNRSLFNFDHGLRARRGAKYSFERCSSNAAAWPSTQPKLSASSIAAL